MPSLTATGRRLAAWMAVLSLVVAPLFFPRVGADSQGFLAPPHVDVGLDTNSDRLYNYLQLDVRMSLTQGGRFTVQVELNDDLDLAPLTDASATVFLEQGTASVRIFLSGPDIYDGAVNGPYYAHITLKSEFGAVLSTGVHKTAAYSFSDFQPYAIRIVPPTQETAIDNDTDGLINWLVLTVSLDVKTEDDYVILSRLVDKGYAIVLVWRTAVHLSPGRTDVSQLFRGYPLRLANVGGPFLVTTDLYDGRGVLVDFLFYESAAYSASSFEGPPVVLNPPHLDHGIDWDGNGLYNFLEVDVRLIVDEDATVILRAELRSGDATALIGSLDLRPTLSKGARTLALAFAGPSIYESGRDGPYQVRVTIRDLDGRLLSEDAHTTQPYTYAQFDRVVISFTPPHTDYGLDADGNGKYEVLMLDVSTTVDVTGTYRFHAVLGSGIAEADRELPLGVGLQTVSLRFEGSNILEAGIDGPYRATIYASDAGNGTVLDIELYRTSLYFAADFEAANSSRILGVVREDSLDTEPQGDGAINVLRVTVRLALREGGRYRLEGSLFAGAIPITASKTTASLPNGTSDIALSFSGWEIQAMGLDGPYRILLALVDAGALGALIDIREFATAAYAARAFQSATGTTLDGRVLSASTGLPLAGAEIWAVNYTNAFSKRTFSDAGGKFLLPLFAATYRLVVDHPEGQAQAYWLSTTGNMGATFTLGPSRFNLLQTDIVWQGWRDMALWVRHDYALDGPALRIRIDWEYGDRDGMVEPSEAAILGTPPFEYGREAIESGSTLGFLHVNGGSYLASGAPVYEDSIIGSVLDDRVPFFQVGRGFFLNFTMPSTPPEVDLLLRVMSDTPEWSRRSLLYVPGSHYLASYETAGPVFVLGRWLPYVVDPEVDPVDPYSSLPYDVDLVLYRRTNYVGGRRATYVAPTPLPPEGLVVKREGSDVLLEWTPPLYNEDGSRIRNLAGYHVYRSLSSGTGYVRVDPLLVRTSAFGDVGAEGAYYYVVTAVNTDGRESVLSDGVSIGASPAFEGGPEAASAGPGGWGTGFSWVLLAPAVPLVALLLMARFIRRRPRRPFTFD